VSPRFPTLAVSLLVCLLVVTATVGAVVDAAAPVDSGPRSDVTAVSGVDAASGHGSAVPQVSAPGTETNETNATNGTDGTFEPVPVVDHEDPRTALGRGDTRAVGSYLVGSMSNRLLRSARLLTEDEYPEARALLGPEYDSLYARYDDVRSDLGVGQEAGERYAVVRDEQVAYITAVQNYSLIREDYLEARRSADSFRSRKLAREMELQAEAVLEHRDNLVANYTLMTEMSGDRRNETVRLVSQQAVEVTALQATVRDQQFVDTRLRVRVPNTSGSFAAPYQLQATVTTADGVPLANESGQLIVGTQRYPVQTDRNGSFAVVYRPATVPDGAATVEARFFVDEESVYLGDRTTLDLFVRQETPTVSVDARPTSVAYDEEFVVSGRVGATVPTAESYVARTDDVNAYYDRLTAAIAEEARTAYAANETGPVTSTVRVSIADLQTVPRPVTVALTVNVTDLTTVRGDPADPANLTVVVDEEAVESFPLPASLRSPLPTEYAGAGNVTLLVAVGDLRLGTVQTAPDGRFTLATPLPQDARLGTQPVRVALVAPDRALAPAVATTTVSVETTPTRVRLDEVTTRGRELLLAGTLRTADGAALSDQQIEIRVDGSVAQTVRTADDGTFEAALTLPDRDESRSTVRVVAAFSNPTSNLGTSQSAASVVTLPEPRTEVAEEVPVVTRLREALGISEVLVVLPVVDVGLSPGLVAGAVGAVVVAVGLLLVARRRGTGPVTAAGRRHLDDLTTEGLLDAGRPDPTDVTDTTPAPVYLRAAREALAASNPRLATEYAYVAVRRHLSVDTTLPVRVTHREFLRAVREGEYDVADVVDTLTTAYERAAFSPHGVTADDAEAAVSAAERLVE
jgi:hypothetical protein